jgi:phosphoglycerate dehydrogenase-like enzyme
MDGRRALDDIEEEPAKQRDRHPANPLLRLHNVIITPHAAYCYRLAPCAGSQPRRSYVLSSLPGLSPVNTIAA